ncbi:MAG: anhydro-N-acetylmuramic acid kinase, partial [Planctomycetota bacterium]
LGDFDRNGERALLGEVRQDLVAAFLDGPFVKQRPPKSTDTWAMIDAFHDACDAVDIDSDWTDFQLGCSPHAQPEHLNMLLATSNATVAACVDLALDWCGDNADASRRKHGRLRRGRYTGELIVTGGGASNASIMRELQQRTGVTPQTGVNLGMPPDAKEAVAFALLGAATLDREPSNVPSATGASRSVVLGSITPKPC